MNPLTSCKRFISPLYSITLFVAMAASLPRKLGDNDIWYHLSIGRRIWSTGHIPATEFLVYPNADLPAELHEWGFGVVAYLLQQLGGSPPWAWPRPCWRP